MTQLRDVKTNETYKGRSADSIARRVWGRKCTVVATVHVTEG